MTVKEYLSQARRLDQMINSNIEEAAKLREMAVSLQCPSLEPNYNATRSTDAPFVRPLEKVLELEEQINAEVDALVELKAQIHLAINSVEDPEERMILRYRYLESYSWSQTGKALTMAPSTARRLHDIALSHVSIPEEYLHQKKGKNKQK